MKLVTDEWFSIIANGDQVRGFVKVKFLKVIF